ncbi:DUF6894 family protein [Pseudorhizobium marinum]|uniref:DUF6894 family protein n=1 Tax=Pseudorhizobium marinum TaxID=1496690 RepID=UPI00068CEB3E|nr:hypothetical protein [Pseudorhizobium marinum]
MPKYFLHLRERDDLIRDLEGANFVDLNAARDESRQAIRDIVAEHIAAGEELTLQTIEICDEQGNHVATVSVASSISPTILVSQDTFESDLSKYFDTGAARCSDIVRR